MEEKISKFIELIDEALREINRFVVEKPDQSNGQPKKALEVLEKLKSDSIAGDLRLPSRGIGWGIYQAVGEWSNDASLLDAIYAVENYYKKNL